MLGQYIHVQSPVSDKIKILTSVCASNKTLVQSPCKKSECADNCLQGITYADEAKQVHLCFVEGKDDLKTLNALYDKEMSSFVEMGKKYSTDQKAKVQMINKLHVSLNQIYQNQSSRGRKGSQISTAGEDEQARTHCGQVNAKINGDPHETIMILEEKLQKLKNGNFRKNEEQIQRIAQLKRLLLFNAEKFEIHRKRNLRQQLSTQQDKEYLRSKILDLIKKRSQLMSKKESLVNKILEQKAKFKELQNKTQYILSTQNCCQQILNQQLNSINYKLSNRRIEYESTKRYMDKVIKQRKYEENVSFKQIQNQIFFLNTYCDQMIHKKNYVLHPDTKRYKQKRKAIMKEISQNHQHIKQVQIKKIELNRNIHEQNHLYAQLQDQYCLLIQNQDNSHGPQRKLILLQQKRQDLTEELQQIISLSEEIKLQIDTNQNLVPQSIVKDLQRKIKNKKIQFQNSENILKQIIQLQNGNKLLRQQKDKIQWRTNPQLFELIEEEKLLIQNQNSMKDSIKILKEQNETIQNKISKFQQYLQIKIQENNNQANQIQKQNVKQIETNQNQIKIHIQQKIPHDRKKLMQNCRQKNLNQNKVKKGKDQHQNYQKKQKLNSKRKEYFSQKETAMEKLRRQFPINSSQETFANSSLLVSNPASWMLVIFVILVIPGLCIGYNF